MRGFTTNYELMDFAKKNKIKLDAVVCKDELRSRTRQSSSLIINLANSTQQGTHWVALYIPDSRVEAVYFDSFCPYIPIEVKEFCDKLNIKKIHTNHYDIQNIHSGYCGQYCH